MTSNRSDKVSDLLKKEISLIITTETKDPRLQTINVTAVKVSDDIGIATVFYTIIGESIHKESSINHTGEYRTSINLAEYSNSIYIIIIFQFV